MRKIIFRVPISIVFLALLTGHTHLPATAQMAENWNISPHQKAEVKISTGLSLLEKGQVETACKMFRQAAIEEPTNYVAYNGMAVALAIHKNYQEALDALQKSYELKPNSNTLLTTGLVYYLMHDYDAAINAWNKLLETNPRAGQVYGNLAFAFLRKGDFTQAEKFFDKLVKFAPHSELGYYGLSLTKYLEGDFPAARASAERAELIYSYPPALFMLARLDLLQGDKLHALKRIQQYNSATRQSEWPRRTMAELGYPPQHSVHWDPFLEDSYDNGYLLSARTVNNPKDERRRQSLANQGKVQQKIEEVRRKLAANGNDYFLLRELGLLELSNGSYASAAETFKKVLAVCPSCSVDLLHQARALKLDGKSAEASELIAQYRKLYPHDELAPTLLAPVVNTPKADPTTDAKQQAQNTTPQTQLNKQSIPSADF